jgi:hypothetical protein
MAPDATPTETPTPPAPPPAPPSPAAVPPPAAAASPDATKPPDAPKPAESASFLELKRQERALREKSEASKKATDAERLTLDKEKASVALGLAKIQEHEKKLARAQQDPVGFLRASGLSEDQIAQAILDGPTPEQIVAATTGDLKADLEKDLEAKIEAKFTERAKKDEETQKQAIIEDWKERSVATLQADAAKYPVLTALGLHAQVVQEMVNVYMSEGIDLTLEEAAANAEAYYAAQYEKVKAVKEPAKPAPAAAAPASPVKEPPAGLKATPREPKPVITNGMAPSASSLAANPGDWEAVKRQVLEKHALK